MATPFFQRRANRPGYAFLTSASPVVDSHEVRGLVSRVVHAGKRAFDLAQPERRPTGLAGGDHLLHKYYLCNVFDLRSAGAGFDKGQPGRPREWPITVRKTW